MGIIGSPFSVKEEEIVAIEKINCSNCGRTYEKVDVRKNLEWIRTSLSAKQAMLSKFETIFPGHGLIEALDLRAVKGITKYGNGVIHLIIEINGTRAYLECQVTNGLVNVTNVASTW